MKNYFIFIVITLFFYCGEIKYKIQNWSERDRKERQIKISEEEIEKWKRELQISEGESKELYTLIEKYANEKKIQGELSWKIANAMVKKRSFEIAQEYYLQAFEKTLENKEDSFKIYESALPYYQKALKNYPPLPDLLYDAALCYGNASYALGWEEERFKTAVFLLERGMSLKPNETRFHYYLAILLGKTTNQFRNVEKAIELLDYVIQKDRYNISSYFTKANILVENGEFQQGFSVYEEITKVIEEMYKKNQLKGEYKKNRQYLKALENMKLLSPCLEGRKECQIKIEKE